MIPWTDEINFNFCQNDGETKGCGKGKEEFMVQIIPYYL